jgi:hypothetical protein
VKDDSCAETNENRCGVCELSNDGGAGVQLRAGIGQRLEDQVVPTLREGFSTEENLI